MAGYTYLQIKVTQRDHTTATLHGRLRQRARRRCGLEASAGIVQSAFSGLILPDSQHTLVYNESAT